MELTINSSFLSLSNEDASLINGGDFLSGLERTAAGLGIAYAAPALIAYAPAVVACVAIGTILSVAGAWETGWAVGTAINKAASSVVSFFKSIF